jgi:hypothetical protein
MSRQQFLLPREDNEAPVFRQSSGTRFGKTLRVTGTAVLAVGQPAYQPGQPAGTEGETGYQFDDVRRRDAAALPDRVRFL